MDRRGGWKPYFLGSQNRLYATRQGKPFRNVRDEVILNLWRTADFVDYKLHLLLKTRDISQTQYNVLRILRGAGSDGLPCGEIAGRLLRHDPDVTRLMDRLVRRGLARRIGLRDDRRVVIAKIHCTAGSSPQGLIRQDVFVSAFSETASARDELARVRELGNQVGRPSSRLRVTAMR